MSEEQINELIEYNLDYSIEEDLEETKKCLKEANQEIERLNNIIKQQDTRNSRQRIANRKLLERNQDLVIENLKLNNIINEINSIVEYWGYDKEHNDISSFRMAMKNIKDVLGSE